MFYITSTYSMTASLRTVIANLQTNLARSQKEMATGRHADLGVALGLRASRSFTLADARDTIGTLRHTNDLVSARLVTTQTALDGMKSDAQRLRATLLASQTDGGDRDAVLAQARQALSSFVAKMNGGDGESYLFGGVDSDAAPLENYFADPPAPNKGALDAAFVAAFGFGQSASGVSSITDAQLQSFLSGGFENLFSDAAWKTDWSHASDAPLRSQIGLSRVIDSSITANEPALRKLAAAYVMVSDLGAEKMNQGAYAVLLKKAMETVDAGISMLTRTQARLGVMQNAVRTSNDVMAVQSDTVTLQLHDVEGVDQTEAAARVNGLMTQIEAAYTLTSRLSQLSLTKYL